MRSALMLAIDLLIGMDQSRFKQAVQYLRELERDQSRDEWSKARPKVRLPLAVDALAADVHQARSKSDFRMARSS